MKLSVGQVVDRKYRVERQLGAGGTAMVYLVKHQTLDTPHALKVLSLSSDTIKERMLREGKVQSQLKHPNVVSVTDVIDVDGAPGLLMEYVDGHPLEYALQRYRLTMGDAETLFSGILSGVRAAHDAGLVHRDLKPANVLLARTPDGYVPKVTDFGLAKMLAKDPSVAHTRSGIAMGTPSYMSPEQIRDARRVDQRADLWSLGCILYELFTRKRAFPGDEALAIYNAVVDGAFIPPRDLVAELPGRIDQAILGCLQIEPDQRIPDCATLRAVLEGIRPWTPAQRPAAPSPLLVETPPLSPDPLPAMSVAQRRSTGTPSPAPERGSRAPAAVAGLEVAIDLGGDETEEVAETVFTQRAVDGTLAPPDSLERERTGLVGWLGGGLLAVGVVVVAVVASVGAGAALVASLLLTRPPAVPEVVEAPEPVVAPPTAPDPEPVVVITPTPAPAPAPSPAKPRPAPSPRAKAPQPRVAPAPAPAPPPAPEPASDQVVTVIRSYPSAALISISGVPRGRTPFKDELKSGRYPVLLTSGDQVGEFVVDHGLGAEWCYSFATKAAVLGTCP